MTLALTAILVFAAGWCIGHHTGRTLRQAAAQLEAMIRPVDGPPLDPQELAALDQLAADLRHDNPRSSR